MSGGASANVGAVPNVPIKITAGMVTRQWAIEGSSHTVSLRHSTFTGFRYLLLDGKELQGTEGTSHLFNQKRRGDTITLQVGRFFVEVTITVKSKTQFLYICKVNGRLQTDETLIPWDPNFKPEYQIKVPGVIRADPEEEDKGANKGPAIFYRVDTVRYRDGKGACNLRRFKHFAELNGSLKSSIYGCHMIKSLPKFPAKGIKFIKRHDNPRFVDDRRKRLQEYLTFLSRIPLISRNAEFLRFLGISDVSASKCKVLGNSVYVVPPDFNRVEKEFELRDGEYSVTFPLGSLGLSLKAKDKTDPRCPTLVTKFQISKDGKQGPAERSGKIRIGDVLSRVNGVNVYIDSNATHGWRIGKIKNAPRPLELHFIRGNFTNEEIRKREQIEAYATAENGEDDEEEAEEFEISELTPSPLRDEELSLTVNGRKLAFSGAEARHYKSLWERCGADTDNGTLDGANGFNFFVLSGLSEDDLGEVWRLSSGGRSLAELRKHNFFTALKFVALAQTGKDIVLDSLFEPNPDGALALPVFDLEDAPPEEYEEEEQELLF